MLYMPGLLFFPGEYLLITITAICFVLISEQNPLLLSKYELGNQVVDVSCRFLLMLTVHQCDTEINTVGWQIHYYLCGNLSGIADVRNKILVHLYMLKGNLAVIFLLWYSSMLHRKSIECREQEAEPRAWGQEVPVGGDRDSDRVLDWGTGVQVCVQYESWRLWRLPK